MIIAKYYQIFKCDVINIIYNVGTIKRDILIIRSIILKKMWVININNLILFYKKYILQNNFIL